MGSFCPCDLITGLTADSINYFITFFWRPQSISLRPLWFHIIPLFFIELLKVPYYQKATEYTEGNSPLYKEGLGEILKYGII